MKMRQTPRARRDKEKRSDEKPAGALGTAAAGLDPPARSTHRTQTLPPQAQSFAHTHIRARNGSREL